MGAKTRPGNPYLFIVGCPRSGTTLLRRMVDAHPTIAITRETHWITRYYKGRKGLTREGFVTPELAPKLFEYHRFPHLKLDRETIEALIDPSKSIHYSTFVTRIFDLFGERKNKPLVGDKTPGYVRNLPLLHQLWPEAKFIHITRDGRDVCLSMLSWRLAERTLDRFATWKEDHVTTVALWWEWHVRLGREGGAALGPELYREIRYEDLVAHPYEECEGLCDFLGVPYDEVMLRFHEGRTRAEGGLSTNRSWLPPTPGVRDWRSQMAAEDLERFEAAAGGLLDDLGYDRAVPNPRPVAVRHAREFRRAFVEDAHSRGSRLPERW